MEHLNKVPEVAAKAELLAKRRYGHGLVRVALPCIVSAGLCVSQMGRSSAFFRRDTRLPWSRFSENSASASRDGLRRRAGE